MRKSLFTFGNPKTAKGEAAGYLTAVLHLAPSDTAGHGNVCASATPGCKAMCLNTAGRGGIFAHGATTNSIQEARKRRTAFYKLDRAGFEVALAQDIARAERKAARMGLRLAVRINGTSDLSGLAYNMVSRFPSVTFYDYTKHPEPARREWDNYSLTFSRSESNEAAMYEALASGVNVAVVFNTRKGKALPATWNSLPVIDGDAHDLRFLDPRTPHGIIIGLRAKGRARKDTSGFVVNL